MFEDTPTETLKQLQSHLAQDIVNYDPVKVLAAFAILVLRSEVDKVLERRKGK